MNLDENTGVIYKSWSCPSAVAIALFVHGLGGFSGRWDYLAEFLQENNIASFAIELKGFGETKDLLGHIDSLQIYFQDIQSLNDIIKKDNRGKKIFLIGESMGALISFLLAGQEPHLFDGLICISPAFKSRLKLGWLDYLKIFFCMVFNPRKQFKMPFNSQMCTRDLEYQLAMNSDPREHRLATARLLLNILLAQRKAHFLKDKFKTPVFFLVAGDDDQLVDSQQTKKFFNRLKIQDKEMIQYPEMYHALSVELGRELVFGDILRWISKRIY